MNEKPIQDIVDAIYALIQDARAVPLATDKCIINRDDVLTMLDQLTDLMPGELSQSRSIVANHDEIIARARREADAIKRQAAEEANRMVSQEAILQEAKRRCQELEEQTQDKIAKLRKLSSDYMDDALRTTQEAIAKALNDVQETRSKFNALSEAQAKRAQNAE